MSVEYCVVRIAPQTFEKLQQQPGRLQELMDEFYAAPSGGNLQKTSVDSREVIRGTPAVVALALRVLYLDEFTTSLLVSFMDESSALFGAVVGWGRAHTLEGVSYGYGDISYYFPDEVKKIAAELNAYPQRLLEERFHEEADNFRIAAAGYLKDDRAILEHQRLFADLLRRFYNEAAQMGDVVLLLTV